MRLRDFLKLGLAEFVDRLIYGDDVGSNIMRSRFSDGAKGKILDRV